jgi:phage baseplate assembly protein W
MQPNFGSGLQELLFDFNDDTLAEKIEDTVTLALENWLPYISVDQIDIDASDTDKDRNLVNVSIKFRVLGNPDLNTVTFNLGV